MGFTIKEGKWASFITPMDQEGEPTRRHISDMLFALCEVVEDLEKRVKELEDYVARNEAGRHPDESVQPAK